MSRVTPIDMLPDLEEVEYPQPLSVGVKGQNIKYPRYAGATMLPPEEQDKFGKFIRNNVRIPGEAGMSAMNHQKSAGGSYGNASYGPQTHGLPPMNQDLPPMPPMMEEYVPQPVLKNMPSCLDCAEHASNCPVCKSYFNNDKTLYIIAIIVLGLVCILLLKKVLDI